jgi:hypothetical protein
MARLGALLSVLLLAGALVAPTAAATNTDTEGDEWVTQLHRAHRYTVGMGVCEWHFVHTKAPRGSDPISLKLKTNRGYVMVGESDKIQANGKNQHWTVTTEGWVKLKTAWTNQTGKLVLSDLTCEKKPSGGGYS